MCQDVDDHFSGVRKRARHLALSPRAREWAGEQGKEV